MRIGIIGAGMIGSTLAKLWIEAGHEVRLATRHPETLQPLVQKLGIRASAGTPEEAAAFGDVVMLTVPLAAVPDLAPRLTRLLKGKVVLDTGNPYEKRDGEAARQAKQHPRGAAGWAAEMFPGSRWVKAFNSVYFKVLEKEAHRDGDRVGIPLAADDHAALETAAMLVRDAGFDPVIVGTLDRGKEFEPDTPPYNTGMSGRELRALFGGWKGFRFAGACCNARITASKSLTNGGLPQMSGVGRTACESVVSARRRSERRVAWQATPRDVAYAHRFH